MRRLLILLALVLAGCPEHGKSPDGGVRDNMTFDPPFADGGGACAPTGGCAEGPLCGAGCCGFGEQCIGGTCICGSSAACVAPDTCQTGGPTGGGICGTICCGSAQNPCPI